MWPPECPLLLWLQQTLHVGGGGGEGGEGEGERGEGGGERGETRETRSVVRGGQVILPSYVVCTCTLED